MDKDKRIRELEEELKYANLNYSSEYALVCELLEKNEALENKLTLAISMIKEWYLEANWWFDDKVTMENLEIIGAPIAEWDREWIKERT